MKNPGQTREEWLLNAVGEMTALFSRNGYAVPAVRVTCGWPSRSALAAKKRRIGECWDNSASSDGVNQIFISPCLDDVAGPSGVLSTLVHEVVHAVVGIKAKHGKLFRKCAEAVGLEQHGHEHLDLVDAGACLLTLGTSTPQASSLTIDNVGAARSVTTHLLGLGHRRIALIAGATDGVTTSSCERRHGYEETLRAARVPVDENLIVPADFSLEGGAEAMERLLRLDVRPTAVFACSDEMAIGAMQVLRDAGIPVPEAMSVVGFDGHEVAEYLGLTTIRQDVLGQGERAGELLVEQLEVEDPPIRHEQYPTRLIVRRTTARPHATAHAG